MFAAVVCTQMVYGAFCPDEKLRLWVTEGRAKSGESVRAMWVCARGCGCLELRLCRVRSSEVHWYMSLEAHANAVSTISGRCSS
jgi:hypothetical protein